jgi:hypothetical protein
MANRRAIFVSAIFAGLSASLPLSTTAVRAASVDQCLTQPGPKTPPGQHWYYHLEHGRQCWYVRNQSGSVARASSSEAAPPSIAQVPKNDTAETSALDNARDEFPEPQGGTDENTAAAPMKMAAAAAPNQAVPAVAPDTTAIPPSPPVNQSPGADQPSEVSSRWPDPSAVVPSTTPPLAADSTTPAPSSRPLPPTSPSSAPPPPERGNATAEKASVRTTPRGNSPASLETLFVVILGALALAGLTASIIYRFGRARAAARRPRAAIWPTLDGAPNPPWSEQAIPAPRRDHQDVPRRAAQPSAAQERMQKIEEILEQLVRQARADA